MKTGVQPFPLLLKCMNTKKINHKLGKGDLHAQMPCSVCVDTYVNFILLYVCGGLV